MTLVFSIAIGGAIGALLRHGVNTVALSLFGDAFPVGTLTVNILGSLAMGIFVGLLTSVLNIPDALRAMVTVGVLGSFTTFSTFTLDTVTLFERGDTIQSMSYLLLSVCGSILALICGLYITKGITG